MCASISELLDLDVGHRQTTSEMFFQPYLLSGMSWYYAVAQKQDVMKDRLNTREANRKK
jgi:hypothetical protein